MSADFSYLVGPYTLTMSHSAGKLTTRMEQFAVQNVTLCLRCVMS